VSDRPSKSAGAGRPGLLPAALILAAAAVAALGFAAGAARRADRAAILDDVDAAPLAARQRDRLQTWTARQNDPLQARLELARFLVNETLSPDVAGEDSNDPEPLALAHRLAAEAYGRRPAAWRAPALMGAALYLQRSLAADRRLITEGSAWEQPLLEARRLTPVGPEPARFLAIAYLELWSTLPEEKRQEARELLRLAFEDTRTFDRLIGPWMTIAEEEGESLDEALAIVPDDPTAWRYLQRTFAQSGDWPSFFAARSSWRRALAVSLDRRLAEAAALRQGGDPYGSRLAYLRVIADAPTETAFAPLVERALQEAPAGPSLPSMAVPLGRWLDWALALDLVGADPLSADALDRLAGMVDGLPAPAAAHAAVAAGRLADAERLARRSLDPAADGDWGGYLVSRARELAARRQGREALVSLDRLPASWQGRPSALDARLDAARAAGDTALAVETEERLAALAAARAGGIEVAGRAGRGALVELRFDGRVVHGAPARGRPLVASEVPIAPGLHLVEAVPVAGTFSPSAVRLLPPG